MPDKPRTREPRRRPDPESYPPGFSWGPRSGYAEEHVSGAPYNLSDERNEFVQWRERRLQELDRSFQRWRADLSRQLDETYNRWIDVQQRNFTDEFQRWREDHRAAGAALEGRGADQPPPAGRKRSGRRR